MTENHTQQPTPIEVELAGGDELELLTVEDVSALFRVPPKWVYAKAASGELPSIKIGVYRRFRREDLRRYLAGPSTSADSEQILSADHEPELIRRPRRSS